MSKTFCIIGIGLQLAIAALHGSGYESFTAQMERTDASDFLKNMFRLLYVTPSFYLVVLSVFGLIAVFLTNTRRAICFVLAPAALGAGALALLIGELVPLVVMGAVAALFFGAGATAPRDHPSRPDPSLS